MFSHIKAAYTRDQCSLASSGLDQLWHRFAYIDVFTRSWYHPETVQFQTRSFLQVNLFGTGQENGSGAAPVPVPNGSGLVSTQPQSANDMKIFIALSESPLKVR